MIHVHFHSTQYTIIKSSPTMWWWRLIVFAESARRRHLFLLSLGNPYSDYFQIFAVCILALENLSGNFFFLAFFSFFNKIQDGRQNPMAYARARTASSICFMFGLNERPNSGRELKSFWCDSNNKNFFYVLVF